MNDQFCKWLGQRISDYAAARERGIKAYNTRLMRIGADVNQGLEPKLSSAGLHAPVDGYEWDDRTFLAGQFLPTPEGEFESISMGAFTFENRIGYVDADEAREFLAGYADVVSGLDYSPAISTGKPFEGRGGKMVYHVYVTRCPKDLFFAISDYLQGNLHKLQGLVEGVTDDAKEARDAAHAAGENSPEGRVEITGIVLALKMQQSEYGETLKMLVQDDRGFRVWGTVPLSLDCNREDRVRFTATVQQSDKDAKFGFFKRPSKASVL